jgi:hypothetical protein
MPTHIFSGKNISSAILDVIVSSASMFFPPRHGPDCSFPSPSFRARVRQHHIITSHSGSCPPRPPEALESHGIPSLDGALSSPFLSSHKNIVPPPLYSKLRAFFCRTRVPLSYLSVVLRASSPPPRGPSPCIPAARTKDLGSPEKHSPNACPD